MLTPMAEYLDAEELSASIKHANVVAVQISRGKFGARLQVQSIGGWSFQHVDFVDGTTACVGQAPPGMHAFVIPMRLTSGYRLLGSCPSAQSIGVYAPGGEHADVSSGGASKVVIVPPPELTAPHLYEEALLDARGSRIWDCPQSAIARFRALLGEIKLLSTEAVLHEEALRSINDALSVGLKEILSGPPDQISAGRPPLPRNLVIRRLIDLLENAGGAPIYAGELACKLQVSDASLRRIFIECFGVPPARYLMLRRLYLARRRLKSGRYARVSEVAHSCGFWELSRFSSYYKSTFGEVPSATLRSSEPDKLSGSLGARRRRP